MKTSIYATLAGGSDDFFSVSLQRKNARVSSFYRCFHKIVAEDVSCIYVKGNYGFLCDGGENE